MIDIQKTLCPGKLKYFRRRIGNSKVEVLDIGCGNHSPSITKHWLPNCIYSGADIAEYNLDEDDRYAMDHFFLVEDDGTGYECIPEGKFDVVIMNHVVEHMNDPLTTLSLVCRKLKPGGMIYIAFPSIHSFSLPSATRGTMHFCDDETHVRVVDVKDVCQTLLDNSVKVLHAGRPIDLGRYLFGSISYPIQRLRKMLTGRFSARGLWCFAGFEDIVLGVKRHG